MIRIDDPAGDVPPAKERAYDGGFESERLDYVLERSLTICNGHARPPHKLLH